MIQGIVLNVKVRGVNLVMKLGWSLNKKNIDNIGLDTILVDGIILTMLCKAIYAHTVSL